MKITTYKTHLLSKQDCLYATLDKYVPKTFEKDILVITSKIISLMEGSYVLKEGSPSKAELIQHSADAYLPKESNFFLTLKNHLLIPAAGIDESNAEGIYIFLPKDSQKTAEEIWSYLCKRDNRKELGVIITDSHTTPLRRGVLGVSLGFCGFKALYSYIGKPDCFGDPLEVTYTNLVDSLAASAVLCMGEGNEQTPIAIIQNAPKIEFTQAPPDQKELDFFYVPMKEDLYGPLLEAVPWVINPLISAQTCLPKLRIEQE